MSKNMKYVAYFSMMTLAAFLIVLVRTRPILKLARREIEFFSVCSQSKKFGKGSLAADKLFILCHLTELFASDNNHATFLNQNFQVWMCGGAPVEKTGHNQNKVKVFDIPLLQPHSHTH